MARSRGEIMRAGQAMHHCVTTSEEAADASLIAQADLLGRLLTARVTLGFAGPFKRELIRDAGEIVTCGLAQRERMLDLHTRLADLSVRFGIDPKLLGDGGDKDEDYVAPFKAMDLSIVRDADSAAA